MRMIISVLELKEPDNLNLRGHFGFGSNCKCFLVISVVYEYWDGGIDLVHDKKVIQSYIYKKTYIQLYVIFRVLGLNELDNVYILILQVF